MMLITNTHLQQALISSKNTFNQPNVQKQKGKRHRVKKKVARSSFENLLMKFGSYISFYFPKSSSSVEDTLHGFAQTSLSNLKCLKII